MLAESGRTGVGVWYLAKRSFMDPILVSWGKSGMFSCGLRRLPKFSFLMP